MQEGRRGVEGVAGYVRTCIWHLAIVTFGFVSASLLSVRLSDCTGVGRCVCVCDCVCLSVPRSACVSVHVCVCVDFKTG